MTVPSIRNYETRPPTGGWGVKYTLKGQVWHVSGTNWKKVVNGIAKIQMRNNAFVSTESIVDYCNAIWCERDPIRCMTPAERSAAQKKTECRTCGGRRRVR